jgi:hypothetical protein
MGAIDFRKSFLLPAAKHTQIVCISLVSMGIRAAEATPVKGSILLHAAGLRRPEKAVVEDGPPDHP